MSAVVALLNGSGQLGDPASSSGVWVANVLTVPYPRGVSYGSSNNIALLAMIPVNIGPPYELNGITATYAGLPCSVVFVPANRSWSNGIYGANNAVGTIAVLCCIPNGSVFVGSDLVITAPPGRSVYASIVSGAFALFQNVSPLGDLGTADYVNASIQSPNPWSMTSGPTTATTDDLLVSFAQVATTFTGLLTAVTTVPAFTSDTISCVGAGNEGFVAYRSVSATESDTVVWTSTNGGDVLTAEESWGFTFRVPSNDAPPSCDPNWSSVSLLVTMNGPNGSNTFTDLSPLANPVTAANGAQISTSEQRFSSGSLNLANTSFPPSQYVSVPVTSGSPLDLLHSANADWTVEGWFWLDSTHPGNVQIIIGGTPVTYNPGYLQVYGFNTGSNTYGFAVQANGIPWTGIGGSPGNLAPDQWNHIAIVRYADHGYLYINGVNQGGSPPLWNDALVPALTPGAVIGFGPQPGGGGSSGTGFLQDWRVTSGLARYTANFAPPVAEYPAIACNVTVPDLTGLTLAAGEALLIADSLTVGTISTGSGGSPGLIYAQSPVGGTVVAPFTAVNITWNPGETVPNLYNLSPAAATIALAAVGLVLDPTFSYQTDALVIAGNIDAQLPLAGSIVATGSAVSVTLSTGPGGAIVPDIIGLDEADAIAAILHEGLIVGTIDSRINPVVSAGLVGYQSPEGGIHVAQGSIVSFSLSLGANATPPYTLVQSDFTWEETVISQYENSPVLLQLVENMDAYVNPGANVQAFYDFVWNVDTAQGFGLDVWGKIVNVSRLLHIPNSDRDVGFQDGSHVGPGPGWDVEPFGGAPGDPAGGMGIWNLGPGATQTYILPDVAYRRLIFVKALANIVATTVPALNQLLQNLFAGRGNVYVTNGLNMTMVIVFADFDPTPVELAILQQSGAFPIPPGVSFTITSP